MQRDVAAELGVTPSALCYWETGITRPRASQLKPLAKALRLKYRALAELYLGLQ